MDKKTYTNAELNEFHKMLDKRYRVKKTLTNGEKVSYIDLDQYLVDQRLCVRHPGYTSIAIYESRLREYEEEINKWEQMKSYKNRVAYAKEKDLEQLSANAPHA